MFSRQRAVLAERFRLVIPSFRGHDGSDGTVPPEYGVGTSDVEDLNAILDAERIEQLRIVGHSSGGATGFVFACGHPGRVTRAVFIEPTLYPFIDPPAREELLARDDRLIAIADNDGPVAALRAVLAELGGAAWNNLTADRQTSRLRALGSCAPMIGPHFRGLRALQVTEADVLALQPPSMLVYGAASFPFEALIADRIRALRPDLPVVTIEGAGHNVHRDRPDVLNPLLTAFLTR